MHTLFKRTFFQGGDAAIVVLLLHLGGLFWENDMIKNGGC